MLTPEEVRTATFRTTRYREGYDQDEVDDLLDRVAATLRGEAPGGGTTAEEVYLATFTSTRLREGYEPDDVDDFLDRVIATLDLRAPSGASRAPVAPADRVARVTAVAEPPRYAGAPVAVLDRSPARDVRTATPGPGPAPLPPPGAGQERIPQRVPAGPIWPKTSAGPATPVRGTAVVATPLPTGLLATRLLQAREGMAAVVRDRVVVRVGTGTQVVVGVRVTPDGIELLV